METKSIVLTNNEIEEIRTSVDIVDIVSSYIPLVTRGKNFFGVCPFHADHSPSMSVSREKQIYTCFSCGASGNVFNFVMNYENVNFIEAVQIIADKAGIPLKINLKQNNTTNKYQNMYDIFELTQKFYVNNINTSFGEQAREYLNKRKFDSKIIKEFGIGLALSNYDALTNLLTSKKYDFKTLLKTGLVVKRERGYSDTYINRIMFPLYDLTGKVVGYSGRIYNSESNSKYFNLKETEIFKKGELLYNYHRAKEYTKIDNKIIIVEGFMDVIRLYSVGIKNVVATMGTAVTKNQALLMKRLAPEIILCFDGDDAGNEATNSCIKELQKIGVIPKIVRLENDLDPDEYVIKNGKEAFIEKIKNPISAMDYKMSYLKKNKDLSNNSDMAKYVDDIIKELNEINNDTYIELTLNKLSNESGINIDYLKNKIQKKEEKNIVSSEIKAIKKNKYDIAEQRFIYYMLNSKDVVRLYYKRKPKFKNEKYNYLAKEILKYYKEYGKVMVADLLTYFESDESNIQTIKELLKLNIKDDYKIEEINDYVNVIEEKNIDEQINDLNKNMSFEIDPIKKAEIAKKIIELKQKKEEDKNND